MAHKKAGGSSRNGRDSAGRRLGVKNMVEKLCHQATLSLDREEQGGFPERTSEWVKTTLCLL